MAHTTTTEPAAPPERPPRSPFVLAALILGAAVANMNLAIANIALPTIGRSLDASQTSLNLVASGFTLGLASSVLYLGAIADRYGRKRVYLIGTVFSIVTAVLATISPTVEILILSRVLGGFAAGMMYPITLSLLTALYNGRARTGATALWAGVSNGAASLAPLVGGVILVGSNPDAWRWVFMITAPLALIVLALGIWVLPKHAGENDNPVDNAGGVISVIAVATLVFAINLLADGISPTVLILGAIAALAFVGFFIREKRAANPLFPLEILRIRTFSIAFIAGVIVFGGLMGALFVGQQFTQNVLGYSALDAGLAVLPFGIMSIVGSIPSARMIVKFGSRLTLLVGLALLLAGFVLMLLTWNESAGYPAVGLAYLILGAGVGIAAPPTARALMGSVVVTRAGVGSAASDLTRDFGGAVFQSIMGAALAAGYAASFNSRIAASPDASKATEQTKAIITHSFGGATQIAEKYPQYTTAILAAAKESFLHGSQLAFIVGAVAALGAIIVTWFLFPSHSGEQATYERVAAESDKLLAAEAVASA